jgi:Putative Flp pilus-assembly TadE/G-like
MPLHQKRLTSAGFRGKRGQVLILSSLTLTLVFATIGFAVDLGYAYYLKQRVQTAADAAASAAAIFAMNAGDSCSTISCPATSNCSGVTAPPSTSLQAGCLYATGDGPPVLTASMIENNGTHPPSTLSGNTPSMWVKATVTANSPNLFFWSGSHTASVSAQSIAGFTTVGSGCIYVLSSSASKALSITGSSTITTNCGIYVNSTASDGFYMYGSPTATASLIQIGCASCSSISAASTTTPAAPYKVGTVTDPLANLPAPSYSGCDQTNYSKNHSQTDDLAAGVFCGGISVTGNAQVTLKGGVYILNGGGLTVANSASLSMDSGKTAIFFNTAGTGQTPGPISIQGNGTVSLTAPTSGTYQGIIFYQDRNVSYSAPNTIANSGTGITTGTYYFPTTEFDFTGNTSTAVYEAFIANTIKIAGSSKLESDTTGTYTGLSKTQVGLLQ